MKETCWSKARAWLCVSSFLLLGALTGCAAISSDPSASIGTLAPHTLIADAHWDSPDFVFLDFQYLLNGKQIAGYARSQLSQPGFSGLTSFMQESSRVGDAVYVKWLHTPSGRVYEKTVSLKGRLAIPVQEGGKLYFVLAHDEPHIYVAVPPSKWPPKPNPKLGAVCKEKSARAKSNPTPDNRVGTYYCGRVVWKVYPEQKQINLVPEQL